MNKSVYIKLFKFTSVMFVIFFHASYSFWPRSKHNHYFMTSIAALFNQKQSIGSFPLSGTVRYSTQLCPFPLSEVVNGTKIANRTTFLVPFRWGTEHSKGYQKGGAKLTAECWLVY